MAVKLTNPKNPLDSDTEYMDPQFLHYLKSEGYSVIEIIGDGNCLFRSIAFLVCGDQDKHKKYRRLVVKHMKLHKHISKIFWQRNVMEILINIVSKCLKMEHGVEILN